MKNDSFLYYLNNIPSDMDFDSNFFDYFYKDEEDNNKSIGEIVFLPKENIYSCDSRIINPNNSDKEKEEEEEIFKEFVNIFDDYPYDKISEFIESEFNEFPLPFNENKNKEEISKTLSNPIQTKTKGSSKISNIKNIENNKIHNNQEILNKNAKTFIASHKTFKFNESEKNLYNSNIIQNSIIYNSIINNNHNYSFDLKNNNNIFRDQLLLLPNEIESQIDIPLNINKSKDTSMLANKKRQRIFSIKKNVNNTFIEKNSKKLLIEKVNKSYNLNRKEDFPKQNKHNKYSPDNMRKRIKCFCLNTFIKKINEILKDIKNSALNKKYNNPINPLKLLTLDYNYITKNNRVDNLNLLKQSLKTILSGEVTGKFDNKDFHNKNLIENLYDIDVESDLKNKEKLKKIKNFLNMKFENFFSSFLNQNETNNEIIFESKEEFMSLIDIYLKNEDDEYKSKFKKMLVSFPSSIEKMRCLK